MREFYRTDETTQLGRVPEHLGMHRKVLAPLELLQTPSSLLRELFIPRQNESALCTACLWRAQRGLTYCLSSSLNDQMWRACYTWSCKLPLAQRDLITSSQGSWFIELLLESVLLLLSLLLFVFFRFDLYMLIPFLTGMSFGACQLCERKIYRANCRGKQLGSFLGELQSLIIGV